jgi:hypothetical protein
MHKYALVNNIGSKAAFIRKIMGKQFNFENIKNNHNLILDITLSVINELK